MSLSNWARQRLRYGRRQIGPSSPKAGRDGLADSAMVAFTGLLVITSVLQWQRIGDQITSAEKIATDNSKDTQAALRVSQSLANSAAKEVSALKDMAAAGRIQAQADVGQMRVAQSELTLGQVPNVQMLLEALPYGEHGPFRAQITITSSGSYTVDGARLYVFSQPIGRGELPMVWRQLRRPILTTDIVPGVPEVQPIGFNGMITGRAWDALVTGQLNIAHVARLVFKDAAGKQHVIERCIEYGGQPPGHYLARDCQAEHH